jgi:hypothetical protein
MPVYGKPMDDHLRRTDRTIALVLEECVKNLICLGGLEEEVWSSYKLRTPFCNLSKYIAGILFAL